MLGRRKMVGALLASAAAIGSGAGLAATHGSLHPAARPTRLPVAHRLGPSVHYPCHHPGGAAAKADL